MTLARFLAELGSKKGAPGGGAAAALTGAAGAALVEMVARLNDARTGKAWPTAAEAAAVRLQLQGLIEKDARAFSLIQKIYKVRADKPAAWQMALKAGARPPMAVCEACAAAAKLAKAEKSRTSAWLESDRREALVLLAAAFKAGELNVEINLRSIEDETFNRRARRTLRRLSRDVR